MAQFQFDASKVQPQGDRTPVAAGLYPAILTSSDIKPNGQNKQLTGVWRITEGPLNGSLVFDNIHVVHSNPVAQQIGQERLSALCHACGILQINDTAQLHGRPHQIRVSITEDPTTKKQYNNVDAFLKADGTPVTAGNTAAPQSVPNWAGQAPQGAPAPAPAPVSQPAPVPQAPPPSPVPAPVPAPPPAVAAVTAPDLFYVSHNGANITPQPVTADVIRTMPQGLAALMVNKVGSPDWVPATTLAQQPPSPVQPAAAGLPPWMQTAA